ncbi:fibronectin type III domain-containing protein [Streptomyces sp. NPDC006527]|uniref:fibronectin type III domain-containing protein n=1 Tax=Streptomyces sp. NPDC006527 TaxID=3364749 RepID=UPI00368DE87D
MNPSRRTTVVTATAAVLATTGGMVTLASVPAAAATTCASPVYKRQIFANTSFSGTAKQTGCDAAISENWGTRAPISGVPSNNFSVRWSVTRDFGSGGPFTLAASGLDGIRVYLDGTLKINLWKNTSTTVSKTLNLTIPQGKHTLRIDYVNWTGSAKVNFSYAPRTSATYDKVRPLTPVGLTTAYDTATGRAKLSWVKNREMDLAGYRVYRRPATGTTWTRLAATTSTTYTDTTLPVTGESYAYQLRAYDKAGNESTGTTVRTVTTADRTAPGVPTNLSVASEPAGLRLVWSQVPGAVSYRVYRTTNYGLYFRLGSTAEATYLDGSAAEGASHHFRVTAVDAAGNESAPSTAVLGERWDQTAPPDVTGLTVTPTEYGFALSWHANPATDLAQYRIRQGALRNDDGEQVCDFSTYYYVPAKYTSYAYTLRPDGEDVCFAVDALDDGWNSSTGDPVFATELDMTPSVPTPEGSPLTLTATAAAGTEDTRLDWYGLDASAPEQAGGYRVYRWNPDTSAYERIAELSSGALEFTDTDGPRGTTSFYWVTAVAADGTETLPAGDYAVTRPVQ